MNKESHNDLLICAYKMLDCFNSIEENKVWNLMSEFPPELAKCIVIMNSKLKINLIEAEWKKGCKQEMEARTSKAAELLAKGYRANVVTTQVAEEYELSRRQARRICIAGMCLIVKDFDEINIELPQIVAKLLVTL